MPPLDLNLSAAAAPAAGGGGSGGGGGGSLSPTEAPFAENWVPVEDAPWVEVLDGTQDGDGYGLGDEVGWEIDAGYETPTTASPSSSASGLPSPVKQAMAVKPAFQVPTLQELILQEMLADPFAVHDYRAVPSHVTQTLVDRLVEKDELSTELLLLLQGSHLSRLEFEAGSVDYLRLTYRFPLHSLSLCECRAVTDQVLLELIESSGCELSVYDGSHSPQSSPGSSPMRYSSPSASPPNRSPSLGPRQQSSESDWDPVLAMEHDLTRPAQASLCPWFTSMRSLRISSCPFVSHRGLALLSLFSNLEVLDLSGSDINNPTLLSFQGLSHLRVLNLERCAKISASGLRCLREFRNLTELTLSLCSRLSGSNLSFLRNVTSLQVLRLRSLNLSDESLPSLFKLTKLRKLDLYGSREVTDKGLAHLRRLRDLEFLCLTQSKITAAGVAQLASVCANLHTLHLTQVNSLRSGGNRQQLSLREELPKLRDLRELKMRRSAGLTDDVMLSLHSLEKLERINLDECRDVFMTVDHVRAVNPRKLRMLQARHVMWSETGFEALGMFESLEYLDISRCSCCPGDLRMLARVQTLKHLDVSFCALAKRDLRAISKLRNLDLLRLKGCEVEDLGALVALRRLKQLRSLNLSNFRGLTDEAACSFLPYLQSLQWLHLKYGEQLTEVTIRELVRMRQLQHVNLEGATRLDDASLERLSKITSLTYLDISQNTNYTWHGFQQLHTLVNLRELNVSGCPDIGDYGMATLRYFPRLVSARVDGSKLTTQGLATIQEAARASRCTVRVIDSKEHAQTVVISYTPRPRSTARRRLSLGTSSPGGN